MNGTNLAGIHSELEKQDMPCKRVKREYNSFAYVGEFQ